MRILCILSLLMFCLPADAAEVKIRLPDRTMKVLLEKASRWYHCPEGMPEGERIRFIADKMILTASFGRVPDLRAAGAEVDVKMESDREGWLY